ncbi:hypothetical protein [Yersinia alsatica]|uniref:hypothetical protein n=1 Tax=Yersinia alsatica TaxID=2890317 RepID=UPI0011A720B3|nr:hypothetical protein [Yersinia alsatica]
MKFKLLQNDAFGEKENRESDLFGIYSPQHRALPRGYQKVIGTIDVEYDRLFMGSALPVSLPPLFILLTGIWRRKSWYYSPDKHGKYCAITLRVDNATTSGR